MRGDPDPLWAQVSISRDEQWLYLQSGDVEGDRWLAEFE